MSSTRNRTSSSYIGRALYLYFLGLSTRNVAKAMFCFRKVKRSHVAIWKWIQKYHPKKILSKSERILEYIMDETISINGGNWYSQACRFLNLDLHIHSSMEKGLLGRTMQFVKGRTECFDNYFPCAIKNCMLKYVMKWLNE